MERVKVRKYRWNRRKFAENLLMFLSMIGMAALLVWMTYIWILTA